MQIASPGMMNPQPMQPMQPMGQQPSGGVRNPQLMAQQAMARRQYAPIEPWASSLRLVLLIFGGMLLVTFLAPWAVGGGHTMFSWTMMKAPGIGSKLWPIVIALCGLLAFVPALLEVDIGFRALGGAIAGTLLILLPFFFGGFGQPGGFALNKEWTAYAGGLGMVLASTGLLIRSQYRAAQLGRLLATIGAVLVLLTLLVPQHGHVPLVMAFKGLTAKGIPFKMKLVPVFAPIYLAILCVLALLVWLGPDTSAGAEIISWLFITFGSLWLFITMALGSFKGIGHNPMAIYMLFDIAGILALATYGYSTIAGKYLE
jgi:hypothetical protein